MTCPRKTEGFLTLAEVKSSGRAAFWKLSKSTKILERSKIQEAMK